MHELIAAFSPERMGTCHEAVSGDHDKAALLHVWNAKVGAAFYGPLQAVEATLRNTARTQGGPAAEARAAEPASAAPPRPDNARSQPPTCWTPRNRHAPSSISRT